MPPCTSEQALGDFYSLKSHGYDLFVFGPETDCHSCFIYSLTFKFGSEDG